MQISDDRVYVWAFLPGAEEPVVAGVLGRLPRDPGLSFQYGRSYLEREAAISLGPDLPLQRESFAPVPDHRVPSTIRDAMPDSWGRQVINRQLGAELEDSLPEERYLLESGSDRVGAIDFQASPTQYIARAGGGRLEAIAHGIAVVTHDSPQAPVLSRSVRNSLDAAGGSQPKAYVELDGRQWLAKFRTKYDSASPLIKGEAAALYLAAKAGLSVPDWRLMEIGGPGLVLLAERFDRVGGARRQVVSGHTLADFHRPSGGSYPALVERLRRLALSPADVGPEIFRRIAFRMVARIDDDHLRNIAAFWDGEHAELTPAFDLSPDLTAEPIGLTDIGGGSTAFSLDALINQHPHYYLDRDDARSIASHMVETVIDHRADAADIAQMTTSERQMLVAGTADPTVIGTSAAGR